MAIRICMLVGKKITCKKFCGKENIYRGGRVRFQAGCLGSRSALWAI